VSNVTAGQRTRAAIWLRVSSGGQDEANQEPEVRAYCERNGYEIVRAPYQVHDRSACKGEHQPRIDEAVADARAGVYDVLVIWHSDRIERRKGTSLIRTLEEFADAGVPVESVKEPVLGQTDFGGQTATFLAGLMNHEKSKHISEQVTLSHDRIRSNKAVIGRAPFGYVITGAKYEKTFAPTKDGRKYVPAIFERVIAGDSTRMIGEWLRSENVQTRQGSNVWSAWGIGHIIRNRAYMGMRVEERTGKLVGRCDPLVDASTWEAANRALTEHAKPKGHARKNSALLTGILRCAKCGGPMYRTNIGRGNSAQLVYRCNADPKFGSERRSECANLVQVALADQVMRRILTLAQAPVMERRRVHARNQPSDRIAEIDAELDTLDRNDADAITRMMALMTERQSLASVQDVPDTWEEVPTGEVWAEVYARMADDAELRAALLAKGVELHVDSKSFPRRFTTRGLGDGIPAEIAEAFLGAPYASY
jgi:DNA invertase Pin-like site-specific DNA recombinase